MQYSTSPTEETNDGIPAKNTGTGHENTPDGRGSRSLANPLPSLFTAIVDQSMTTKPFTPTYSCRYCTIDGRGYQYPTKPLSKLAVAAEDQLSH